jgi:transcriptional regulator with XRE-family HTH domain
MSIVGDNLNALCARHGISNAELAAIVGIEANTVTKWFSGEQHPRESSALRLCQHYGWEYDDIFSRSKGGAARLFAELEAVGWNNWQVLGIKLTRSDRLNALHERFHKPIEQGGWGGHIPCHANHVPLLELHEVRSYLTTARNVVDESLWRFQEFEHFAASESERPVIPTTDNARIDWWSTHKKATVPDDVWAAHPCAFALRSTDPAMFGVLPEGCLIVLDLPSDRSNMPDNTLVLCLQPGHGLLVRCYRPGYDTVLLASKPDPRKHQEGQSYDLHCAPDELNVLATVVFSCQNLCAPEA